MRRGLSGDGQAFPAALAEFDEHAIDVRVAIEEMPAKDECEIFDAGAEVLVGEGDDRVFDGVRRDDLGVVVAQVGALEGALEEDVGGDFDDGLRGSVGVFAQHAHLVFSVAIGSESGHEAVITRKFRARDQKIGGTFDGR